MLTSLPWYKRLFLWYFALFLGSFFVWTVMGEGVLEEAILAQTKDLLLRKMEVVKAEVLESGGISQSIPAMDKLADQLGSQFMVRVSFISLEGRLLGDSHVEMRDLEHIENHGDRPEVKEAMKKGVGWAFRHSQTMGVDSFYLASLSGTKSGSQLVIRLAIPASGVLEARARLRRNMAWIAALSLALLFLGTRMLSKGINRWQIEILGENLGELREQASPRQEGRDGSGGKDFKVRIQHVLSTLEEAKHRLDALLDGMAEGVMLLDSKGKIELINKALSSLMEARVDPIGRSPAEAYRSAALQEAVSECMAEKQPKLVEIRSQAPLPKVLEIQVSPTPQGGAVAVFRDVTEKRRIEEIKKNLVVSVSHELRTPLTAMRGAVESLLDGALDDSTQAQRFANMIHRQVLRLEKMVKDLLDLSRLEAEDRPPEFKVVKAREIASEALENVREMAESKGLELQCLFTGVDALVHGNPRDLEQALVNLLTNAIQFTERGRVVLRVDAVGNEVLFSVEDTGIGIPEEHLPRIFDRFYRVNKDRSRDTGGSGLGLSIVKHIVQNHGGRVEVESTPGIGSTFRLILPRTGEEKDHHSGPLRRG